jgi:hypothetical protein
MRNNSQRWCVDPELPTPVVMFPTRMSTPSAGMPGHAEGESGAAHRRVVRPGPWRFGAAVNR